MISNSIRFLLQVVLFSAVLLNCRGTKSFEKHEDGVVIRLDESSGNGKTLKLKVLAPDIIQVVISPTDTFSTAKSLVALRLPSTTQWTVEESKDEVILITSALKAKVSTGSGQITFIDSLGNIVLRQKVDGKSFQPLTDQNIKGYQVRQVFESADDEAFYGLGGHQNGQVNYKGEDVDLTQHNIVDVVPFLYSNKNYGLLWDNYSITKFGDSRNYTSLSSLQLLTKDGKPGGLTAEYYSGNSILKTAVENNIEYEFLETPQVDNFPKTVAQNGKVVWSGSFSSQIEGDHKFLLYSSGYTKVWIDGKLIIDSWRQNWNPWTQKFKVDLKKGQLHTIRIEWNGEGGYIALKHLDPISQEEQDQLSLTSEVGDEVNYYFIKGNSADDVIKGYRTLTGKAPIVPQWALGFWQSRERYKSQQDLEGVVKEYRKRNIPLDNIVLDWQYWEDPKWGSHEFDTKRFPDAACMVKDLHDKLNAHLMISVWPKFNKGTAHYDEMNKNGYLFTRNIEKKRKDWVGIGYESTFYDPFNEGAGKLFWKQIDEKLNVLGVDAWWLDATEPDMHSNLSIDERKLNMTPTALGPGAKYFNAYSLMNSKSVYEGQRKSSPDKRVFILTRSAFAGQQRYGAATWSGDIVSRWSDFKDQIAAGINFSLSGIPYWTMDIGGFAVEKRYENAIGETLDEWRELNTRWFQFGAFCPLFRSHGQYPFREIYNIADEGTQFYESMVYYNKLRYRLMPYIYSIAASSYWNDYTIMRGLVMDFNNDKKVHDIGDQYMFGSALLINPVYEHKSRSRDVYLPEGVNWFDFYTGKNYKGGEKIVAEAPLEKMPLFVKAGSIIPAGPEIQYTNQKTADTITLYVFTGSDGNFSLYEDEGVNYNYENGKYANIPMTYSEKDKTLKIGKREGEFNGMLKERTFEIVWVRTDKPAGVSFKTPPDQVITYKGDEVIVNMN